MSCESFISSLLSPKCLGGGIFRLPTFISTSGYARTCSCAKCRWISWNRILQDLPSFVGIQTGEILIIIIILHTLLNIRWEGDIIPAVDFFTPADIICRPFQLRNRDVDFQRDIFFKQPHRKRCPIGLMFNLRTQCTTDNCRARRRKLCISTMSVRLLTVTNSMMKLTSIDVVSRSRKLALSWAKPILFLKYIPIVTGLIPSRPPICRH